MQIGCNRFTESDWMEYILAPAAHPAMAQHLVTCAACRSEVSALEETGGLLRHVSHDHEAVRDAFARSVVAEHLQSRPVPSPSRVPASLDRLRHPRFLSLAGAGALCLLLVVASLNGRLPWGGNADAPLTSISMGHVVEEDGPQLLFAMDHSPVAGEETVELFMAPGPALLSVAAPESPVVSHVLATAVHEGPEGNLTPEGIVTSFEPGVASFHTLTHLVLDEGTHDVNLTIFDPAGALVAAQYLPSLHADGPSRVEPVWVEWTGVAFTESGVHRLVITVDGSESSFPIPVGMPDNP